MSWNLLREKECDDVGLKNVRQIESDMGKMWRSQNSEFTGDDSSQWSKKETQKTRLQMRLMRQMPMESWVCALSAIWLCENCAKEHFISRLHFAVFSSVYMKPACYDIHMTLCASITRLQLNCTQKKSSHVEKKMENEWNELSWNFPFSLHLQMHFV